MSRHPEIPAHSLILEPRGWQWRQSFPVLSKHFSQRWTMLTSWDILEITRLPLVKRNGLKGKGNFFVYSCLSEKDTRKIWDCCNCCGILCRDRLQLNNFLYWRRIKMVQNNESAVDGTYVRASWWARFAPVPLLLH